jgi:Uma2 family endonuclease
MNAICLNGWHFLFTPYPFSLVKKELNLNKAFVMTAIVKEDICLPLYLPFQGMTDEELYQFCSANKHLHIERDENNQLIIMAPIGGETGSHHSEINFEIQFWNRRKKSGKVFDSSTGFQLPDNSMRSPDVAWIPIERWNSLSSKQKKRFLPFAPDFLVEVVSPTDDLDSAKEKMNKWIQNGSRLGWLIVPEKQTVFIYRADGTVDKVDGFDKTLPGEDVLQGFNFNLKVLL